MATTKQPNRFRPSAKSKHHSHSIRENSSSTADKANSSNTPTITWWQFALFGGGCTVGTAFFLGSSLAIQKSGYLVLPLFALVAIVTYFVYDALARMTANQPEKGSFRTYAKQAFGRWAGFSNGWVYWASEMLILGASLTALGLFSRFWFPAVPLWIFATGYAVLALLVVILGSQGINKAENMFAIVKIAAVLMFIGVAGVAVFQGGKEVVPLPKTTDAWLKGGWTGAWKGLLYSFYAFSGIEVMGFMAMNLKNPKDAPKSGRIMLIAIAVLYILSIGLAMMFVPIESVTQEESPLILALEAIGIKMLVHILNGVLIIAGFSILVASLYGVSTMLVTLSEDGDAPKLLSKSWGKRKLPIYALGMNAIGMSVSILMALWIPKQIFEHIVTAGGLVLLYVWLFIVASYLKLLKPSVWGQVKSWFAILILLLAALGALLEPAGRTGFWTSLVIVAIIASVTVGMQFKWKKEEKKTA
ncbi:L-asparagine transporter-like permease [Paenibacillus shirakamiensis]|uniref:L-asparagine transporter-like permease n=1 Tax=Paenibacillus shirakamiensis TaxID=1265935 RepID=A0ABS4JDT3_9BACL|nr:amino acid permease [Paenibacillus shirakamiensis]MBP1999880.1 L-asparagine transporter-like permease [Paenibacillus shirakamiensis]